MSLTSELRMAALTVEPEADLANADVANNGTLGRSRQPASSLPGIADGSRGVGTLPLLCVRIGHLVMAPRAANPATPAKRRC